MKTNEFRTVWKRVPAWKCVRKSSTIGHLDEVWVVQQWRESVSQIPAMVPLENFQPHLSYLARMRYGSTTDLLRIRMSPQLSSFVQLARAAGVGREACALACLLECQAANIPPAVIQQVATPSHSAIGDSFTATVESYHLLELGTRFPRSL